MIPFKGEQKTQEVLIKSPCGLSLSIPSTGYASVKEYQDAIEILLRINNVDGTLNIEKARTFESDIVTLMLRYRFNDFKSPQSKLLQAENETPISAAMMKALFAHFQKELGIQSIDLPMGDYAIAQEENISPI